MTAFAARRLIGGDAMNFTRRRFLHLPAGAAALPAASRIAGAQTTYPTRPITMIVPYPAGGLSDVIARVHRHLMPPKYC